jgi:hypothetical protein
MYAGTKLTDIRTNRIVFGFGKPLAINYDIKRGSGPNCPPPAVGAVDSADPNKCHGDIQGEENIGTDYRNFGIVGDPLNLDGDCKKVLGQFLAAEAESHSTID